MGEAMKWAEFAMLAEGHRRAGMLDQAAQLARSGLDEHPDCAEGALVMALVLLDQNRDEEARRVIADWTDTNLGIEVTSGRYVLLLNNDTLIDGASLDAMVDFLDAQPEVGAVGGRPPLQKLLEVLEKQGFVLVHGDRGGGVLGLDIDHPV